MQKVSFGPIWDEIQKVRQEKNTEEAIKLANYYISKDTYCVEAYMQLIDMYYIMGELEKAEKPIDFILANKLEASGVDKSLLNYIKAVLLSERTEWEKARKYIKTAISLNGENLEYERLLATIEFRSGNKQKGYSLLKNLLKEFYKDADIILDAVNMALNLGYLDDAREIVKLYFDKKDEISFFSRNKKYYDKKMENFKQALFSE